VILAIDMARSFSHTVLSMISTTLSISV
jgi:hypothetical protein